MTKSISLQKLFFNNNPTQKKYITNQIMCSTLKQKAFKHTKQLMIINFNPLLFHFNLFNRHQIQNISVNFQFRRDLFLLHIQRHFQTFISQHPHGFYKVRIVRQFRAQLQPILPGFRIQPVQKTVNPIFNFGVFGSWNGFRVLLPEIAPARLRERQLRHIEAVLRFRGYQGEVFRFGVLYVASGDDCVDAEVGHYVHKLFETLVALRSSHLFIFKCVRLCK